MRKNIPLQLCRCCICWDSRQCQCGPGLLCLLTARPAHRRRLSQPPVSPRRRRSALWQKHRWSELANGRLRDHSRRSRPRSRALLPPHVHPFKCGPEPLRRFGSDVLCQGKKQGQGATWPLLALSFTYLPSRPHSSAAAECLASHPRIHLLRCATAGQSQDILDHDPKTHGRPHHAGRCRAL